jgi:asparagine synthase (glutamine-hydrolysing)
MCGIAGLFELRDGKGGRDPAAIAQTMVDAIAHRGPDGRDAWGDPEAGIGFGHGRLAVIDLSPGGAQPMHSSDGRYVITYNGEIYNFQDLRAELAARGHTFQSTSDTEVMLTAFREWGPEEAVKRFIGMFALRCSTARSGPCASCATASASSRSTGRSWTARCCSARNCVR